MVDKHISEQMQAYLKNKVYMHMMTIDYLYLIYDFLLKYKILFNVKARLSL